MTDFKEEQETGWLRDYLLVCFVRFGVFLAFHQMQPVFPLYLGGMGASSTIIGAVMGAFTFTATISRLPIGLVIDRFSRKPFLISGLSLFTLAVLGYLWAPSILFIALFRILHGIGWSGCTTVTATLTADIAPKKRRGELISYGGVANSVAAALGPIAGFALLHRFGYEGTFLGALGIVLLTFVLAWGIREPAPIIAPAPTPRNWIDTIAVRDSLLPATTIAFITFGAGGISTFLPLYAIELGLKNPGLWFAVFAACLLLSRPIAGPLSDRISRRAVILPGSIVNLIGLVWIALAPSPSWLLVGAVITGFGFGAAHPTLMTLAVDQTSDQRRGQSLAQFQLFYDLGIGLGSMMLGTFLDMTNQNFSAMYLVAAAVGALGLLIYWLRG